MVLFVSSRKVLQVKFELLKIITSESVKLHVPEKARK
jgi:hypothetical protein